MDCNCEPKKLFALGCKCGAFKFENSNHIWFNGVVYGIGKTAEEARELSKDYLLKFDDFDPNWIDDKWNFIPDEEPLTLIIHEDMDNEETRFAWEWVKYYGPGFLAAV